MSFIRFLQMFAAMAGVLAFTLTPASAAPGKTKSVRVEVVTLGTGGGPMLRRDRAQSANALIIGKDVYLVDVGDGAMRQIARAGIDLRTIRALFVTHLHIDHVADLNAFLMLRWALHVVAPLPIYGPPGIRHLVSGLISADQPTVAASKPALGPDEPDLQKTVRVVELDPGMAGKIGHVAVHGFSHVSFVRNSHFRDWPASAGPAPVSLSYRFSVGRCTVVFTGDTGPSPAVQRLARGADMMVSELIDLPQLTASWGRTTGYSARMRATLIKRLAVTHLTPNALGELAGRAAVHNLIVSHLVPGIDRSRQLSYLQKIRAHYAGPVVIAEDLDRFPACTSH